MCTMKLFSVLLLLSTSSTARAFAPSGSASVRSSSATELSLLDDNDHDAQLDRRSFTSSAGLAFFAATAAASTSIPLPARAIGYFSDYTPKFDDLKQIYVLGVTLDRLVEKIKDPEKYDGGREMYDKALEGLRQWNKDPNFYVGYAQNYLAKVVKRGSADDPRLGYIKEASANISSCQELLEGRVEGLSGKAAGDEAIKRVKASQKLIGKFLAESGVEGEGADKIAAYVSSH